MNDASSPDLPCLRAGELAVLPPDERWLIRGIWGLASVGIVGGQPKCCKSWLGLDMATSVASGTPCLGLYPVEKAGRALVYLAEDSLAMVRARLECLCRVRDLDIATLDLHVITVPVLRLDQPEDRLRLRRTLDRLRPRILVLDPLVRLHHLDENSARDISGLLGYLRDLQRQFDVAIVLVHHARKRSAAQPGQALRGSSDLHAWTDVTACLSRTKDDIVLAIEHRSARSLDPIRLRLIDAEPERTHLRVIDGLVPQPPEMDPIDRSVIEILTARTSPMTTVALRNLLNVQKQRLVEALKRLAASGAIQREGPPPSGWALAQRTGSDAEQSLLPLQ